MTAVTITAAQIDEEIADLERTLALPHHVETSSFCAHKLALLRLAKRGLLVDEMVEALNAMVNRWEPDVIGTDHVMWENARAVLAKVKP